jgi:hypothetical protein
VRGYRAGFFVEVIARLDRATQYSRASAVKPQSCGVLDTRFRGYDSFAWVRWHTMPPEKRRQRYFFFVDLAFGSGFSACGSKPR